MSVRRQDSRRRRDDAVAGRSLRLHVYRANGDSATVLLPINKNLKQIKKKIGSELKIGGDIDRILSCNLLDVESGEHFRDGGQYIVLLANENLEAASLPQSFNHILKGTNFHVDIDKVRSMFPQIGERQLEKCLLKFNVYDENGDGFIEISDAPSILESVGYTAKKEEIQMILVDKNLDQKPLFDFYEFLAMTQSLDQRRTKRSNPRSSFCEIQ